MLTSCIEIGVNTLQTAIFDAKFVIIITTVTIIKTITISGKTFSP